MKSIEIDRKKPLKHQPHAGHNRWHPDIPPVLEVDEGDEVLMQTQDAGDGQLNSHSSDADILRIETGRIHPLTGPIFVKGAKPGDLLEVEFLDIIPEAWAYTVIRPGMGFLRDLYTKPYLVHWNIAADFATSPQLPGVRIPAGAFMGIAGVAPSHEQVHQWTQRELKVAERGGLALPPSSDGAVPEHGPAATKGLRTLPPRENGGNFDVKQLTRGAKLLLPVFVEGGLFSTGDGHFAQGDGEVCLTAIEMGATAIVRFHVLKGEAVRRKIGGPRFSRSNYFADPRWAVPERFIATMGIPLREDGSNEAEDLTLACRNALLNMIQLLEDRGWNREQAYVLCSVAVDLKISNVVDLPNVVVTAFLPEDIFV